jgi:hypothetical protein
MKLSKGFVVSAPQGFLSCYFLGQHLTFLLFQVMYRNIVLSIFCVIIKAYVPLNLIVGFAMSLSMVIDK